MTPIDATSIVNQLVAAGLVGAIDGQGLIWAQALKDIPANEAHAAATYMIANRRSTERWATPGDLRAAVTHLRHQAELAEYRRNPSAYRDNRCPWWRACQCTHTRCEHGWITTTVTDNGIEREVAHRCGQCELAIDRSRR